MIHTFILYFILMTFVSLVTSEKFFHIAYNILYYIFLSFAVIIVVIIVILNIFLDIMMIVEN